MGIQGKLIPEPVRESYLRKFTAVIVGLVVLGALIGVVMTGQVSGLLADQSESDMQATAQLSADAVETWVQSHKQSARMVASYEELQGSDGAAIERVLRNERAELPGVLDIHYLEVPSDGSPRVVESTSFDAPGTTFADLGVEWSSERSNRLFRDTDPVEFTNVYERGGDSRIGFVAGVEWDIDTNTGTAVMIVADTSAIDFATAADGGFTQVVQSDGTIQLASDPSAIGSTYTASSLAVDDREPRVQEDGENLVATAPVDGVNWIVVSHAPLSSVYQLRSTTQLMMGGLIGFFLLGFVFVGATIGRNTVASLRDLTGKAEQLRDGDRSVVIDSERDDEIGTLYDSFAEMRDALDSRIKEAEVARAEAVEMNEYLEGKADEYADTLQRAAAGDLTARLEQDGETEAMDRIAAEFNEMIEELEKTTGQLKSFADEVETAGQEVNRSADTVRHASEEVADTIQRVSDDAYDQRERLQTISETMDEIAADLDAFAAENDVDFGDALARIEDVAGLLTEVADLSEETMAEAETVAGAAEEQAAELNEVSERANDLTRYANPLQEVLDRFQTESEHEFYFPTGPGADDAEVHGDG